MTIVAILFGISLIVICAGCSSLFERVGKLEKGLFSAEFKLAELGRDIDQLFVEQTVIESELRFKK